MDKPHPRPIVKTRRAPEPQGQPPAPSRHPTPRRQRVSTTRRASPIAQQRQPDAIPPVPSTGKTHSPNRLSLPLGTSMDSLNAPNKDNPRVRTFTPRNQRGKVKTVSVRTPKTPLKSNSPSPIFIEGDTVGIKPQPQESTFARGHFLLNKIKAILQLYSTLRDDLLSLEISEKEKDFDDFFDSILKKISELTQMVESLSTNPDITNEQVEEYNDDYEKDKILFERLKRIKKPITTFEEPVYHKRFKPHELIYSTRFSPPSQQIKDNYKNHMSDFITGNKQQILYAIFYTPARYEKLKGYKKDIESIFYKVIFKPGKPAYDLATQTDEFLNTLNDTIKGLRQGYSRTSDTMKYIDEKYTDIMKKYAELPKKKPFKFTFSLGAGTKIGGTRKKKK